MNRRDVLKSIGITTVVASTQNLYAGNNSLSLDTKHLPFEATTQEGYILPLALKPGDTIGITAPASGIGRGEMDAGIEYLKKLGFKIVLGQCLYRTSGNGFLSASDEKRASEFMEFVQRDDINAILCARGGYGVMRILPMLDYDIIRKNKKIICGYSDITALLVAILQKSKLVCYHGPVAISDFDEFTSRWFDKILLDFPRPNSQQPNEFDTLPDGVNNTTQNNPINDTLIYTDTKFDIIAEGKATGKLIGGNLTMLCATLGTEFEVDTTNTILYLEDVSEEPYKIDRMVTQLWLAKKLNTVRGVILGVFNNCDPYSRPIKNIDDMTTAVRDVFESRLGSLNIPIISGVSIGHIKSKLTVPNGIVVTLNTNQQLIQFEEPTVIRL